MIGAFFAIKTFLGLFALTAGTASLLGISSGALLLIVLLILFGSRSFRTILIVSVIAAIVAAASFTGGVAQGSRYIAAQYKLKEKDEQIAALENERKAREA